MKLSSDNPHYEFNFIGECLICATGEGEIRIQRKLVDGGDFVDVTDDYGTPMVHVSQNGVIFNGSIKCSRRIPHRIVASTTKEINLEVRC